MDEDSLLIQLKSRAEIHTQKGMDILSKEEEIKKKLKKNNKKKKKEEEGSKSDTRQRHIPGEECKHPE